MDKEYSGGDYHMKSLWSSGALRDWASRQEKTLRFLDVGCGRGIFIKDFVQGMGQRWNVKPARVMGIDRCKARRTFSKTYLISNFACMIPTGTRFPLKIPALISFRATTFWSTCLRLRNFCANSGGCWHRMDCASLASRTSRPGSTGCCLFLAASRWVRNWARRKLPMGFGRHRCRKSWSGSVPQAIFAISPRAD